jgi:hypothetical protein
MAMNWKKGIPMTALKKKWKDILFILQKYITCKGRYGLELLYHLWLLIHFKGHAINFPYFLLNILKKMAYSIQHSHRNIDKILYHHGMVKILLETKLHKKNDNWEAFLVRNHFRYGPEETKVRGSKLKQGTTRVSEAEHSNFETIDYNEDIRDEYGISNPKLQIKSQGMRNKGQTNKKTEELKGKELVQEKKRKTKDETFIVKKQ